MNQRLSILFFSVALNLLLLGGVAGFWLGKERPGKRPSFGPSAHGPLEPMSPQQEDAFHQTMEKVRGDSEALRSEIEKVREEVFTALTAESFSAQVYQQKVDALHTLHGRQAQVLSAAVKEMAKSLSQTERRALAERLRRMPENRPPQGGGPRRPPPPPQEGEESGMPPPPPR